MRIVLVTNIPAPYRIPLYERVRRRVVADGGDLSVIYGAAHEQDRQWADQGGRFGSVPSVVMARGQIRVLGRKTYLNPGVVRVLQRLAPDVVIAGGYAPWMFAVATWARIRKVPYLIWSGETPASAAATRPRRLRRASLIAGASGFLAYGPEARTYLVDLGVDPEKVTVLGNGIDMDAFADHVTSARKNAQAVRAKYRLSGHIALSVGGKNLAVIQQAVERMGDPPQVVVVGGAAGPERADGIRMLGRLPADEMPGLYAVAGCLVHPPVFDQWPHAINEALTAGVPAVASPHCGVPDSILSGPGCAIVEPDPEEVAPALHRALTVSSKANDQVRSAIAAPLRPWAVDRMAERFVAAARRAIEDARHTG